jgi:hypothetical protein
VIHPYSTPSGWWVKLTDPNTGQDRELGPFARFDAAWDYANSPAPLVHEPVAAYQVAYPGGKDGLWRAGCACGYLSGFDSKRGAETARDQHITAVAS